jgi:hypothetical protein
LVRDDPRGVASVRRLSKASHRKMLANLWWAAGYNVISIPLAAGVLAWAGVVLPAVGALTMSVSTIVVALNAQLLPRVDLRPGAVPEPAGPESLVASTSRRAPQPQRAALIRVARPAPDPRPQPMSASAASSAEASTASRPRGSACAMAALSGGVDAEEQIFVALSLPLRRHPGIGGETRRRHSMLTPPAGR